MNEGALPDNKKLWILQGWNHGGWT